MKKYKGHRHVHLLLCLHDQVADVVALRSDQGIACQFRIARNKIFTAWAEVNGLATTA